MGVLAVVFSLLAWCCMGLGIVTLLGVLDPLKDELTWMVWFGLSALLFLASIASNMGKRQGGGEEF